jgi:hypothetical protein
MSAFNPKWTSAFKIVHAKTCGLRQQLVQEPKQFARKLKAVSNDPVQPYAHYFACAGASRGQARKTRLRELPSHAAQAQMTSLT